MRFNGSSIATNFLFAEAEQEHITRKYAMVI